MADSNQSSQGNQQGSTTSTNKPAGLSWSQPQSPRPVTSPLLGGTAQRPPMLPVTPKQSVTQSANNSRRYMVLFLTGVVVGGVLTWGYYTLQPQSEVAQNTNNAGNTANTGSQNTGGAPAPTGSTGAVGATPTSPAPAPIASSGSLIVPTVQDAGLTVAITKAQVKSPTWVVVYEVANGARGNALGAGYFLPTTGVRNINLLRPTQAGKTYWVGMRVDNGDQDFSMTLDQPVLNAAGQPLYVEFTVR